MAGFGVLITFVFFIYIVSWDRSQLVGLGIPLRSIAKPKKVTTLDILFANNDQLKTNTLLQMKDTGIDFNYMRYEEIRELFSRFESAASVVEGIECWSAREMQVLLGYSKWENFDKVIQKAKDSCTNA